jgi:hypothetical protein
MNLKITKAEPQQTATGKNFLQCEGITEDGRVKQFSVFYGKEKIKVGETIDITLTPKGQFVYGKPVEKKIYRQGPPAKEANPKLEIDIAIIKSIFPVIYEKNQTKEDREAEILHWVVYLRGILEKNLESKNG